MQKVGHHMQSVGERFGMIVTGTPAFRARRIEAGLLSAGVDFDHMTTPFAVRLGRFVDLETGDFVGRDALAAADRRSRLRGFRIAAGSCAAAF